MAVRKFPQQLIDDVISSAEHTKVGNEKVNKNHKVHIKISKELLAKIDNNLKKRYNTTRSNWIREAIIAKLEYENDC